jgi:SET domain-containing protein
VLALRDIQAGEELTFNYRYDTKKHRCHCGASHCCGYILDESYW